MTRWKLFLWCSMLGLLSCKKASPQPPAAQPAAPPRLLVLIVVDQMRGDELLLDDPLWQHGFRRLREQGRVYTHAFYRHGRTVTAAGHATLATGVAPRHHGVVDNVMFIPERGQAVAVCDLGDPPCSGDALLAPTLGDRLKAHTPASIVVTMAEKARSANMMGGHRADLVVWHADDHIGLLGRIEGRLGVPPWLTTFFERVASPERISRIWELPRLPEPFASRRDDSPAEVDCGHGTTFPHHLTQDADGPRLVTQWHCTPDSDRSITEAALHAVARMELGSDDTPDLLMLSLSSVDVIGHNYGFESLERVAALTELDRYLGDLLQGLHDQVGQRLLVAITADHGVAPRVDTAREAGFVSGRVDADEVRAELEKALAASFGSGRKYVASVLLPYIALTALPSDLRDAVIAKAVEVLRSRPDVYKAWPSATVGADSDDIAQLMAASVYPGRSGDVVVALEPYFAPAHKSRPEGGADHGSPWPYDRNVPLVLWGDGVVPGKVDTEVDALDLTRTLADRLGLPIENRGGKPLPP